ncbi:hypothetical protein [Pyxidicoccus sp. MSG2]|uniref:hypothetical protein n=1 Tax=Pyxidicoccus sp. MSG2 TaxID=2996790 RepID=UPI0022712490|nr:hypothetical protein [Pyxidicoccus sp. MSG2]MCY1019294.1 hypothetical protein [Pyxidicoccus sp. MSG2]
MALVVATLKSQLELNWLVPKGGSFPENVQQSANRFADAVATWFSTAQANLVPCTTAQARKGQLATQAASAFNAGSALAAGQDLATALSAYIQGQLFGTGTAGPPAGTALAASAFGATFTNVDLENGVRAQQLAQACQALALSTVVAFPTPLPPGNVA